LFPEARVKPVVLAPLFLALTLPVAAAAAPFTNGNFSAGPTGLDGWRGLGYDFSIPGAVDLDPPAAPFFVAGGDGSAALGFDDTQPDIGIVELYQSFAIASVANPLRVAFRFDWAPSAFDSDGFELELLDDTGISVNFVELLFGDPIDYAAAAGWPLATVNTFLIPAGRFASTALTLRFALSDSDLVITDRLTLADVDVTEISAVPSPAPLLLLACGALGLAAAVRRRRAPPDRGAGRSHA
jgi:hypothetical protein